MFGLNCTLVLSTILIQKDFYLLTDSNVTDVYLQTIDSSKECTVRKMLEIKNGHEQLRMFYSKYVSSSNQLQYRLELVFKDNTRCKSPNYTIINDYSGYKNSTGANVTEYCLAKPWIWIFTSVGAIIFAIVFCLLLYLVLICFSYFSKYNTQTNV